MQEKDDVWATEGREAFVRALQARIAARDGDVSMPADAGGESA
jgi:hypothetical protein